MDLYNAIFEAQVTLFLFYVLVSSSDRAIIRLRERRCGHIFGGLWALAQDLPPGRRPTGSPRMLRHRRLPSSVDRTLHRSARRHLPLCLDQRGQSNRRARPEGHKTLDTPVNRDLFTGG